MPTRLALALAFALALLFPGASHAATYTQYACHLPDGTPIAADGFSGYANGASTLFGVDCLADGWLYATVPGVSSGTTNAGVKYVRPSHTTVVGLRAMRETVGLASPSTVTYDLVGATDSCHTATCPTGLPLSLYSWTGSATTLDFRLDCPPGGCGGSASTTPTIKITRAEIDLSDAANPAFSVTPSGGLFDTTRALRGAEQISFTATDQGGGVAEARILVDGVEVDSRVPDDNGGGCVEPYVLRVPCKATVAASYAFDTTQLTDGAHTVELRVSDATGTNHVSYGPVTVNVDNTPAAPATDPGTTSGGSSGAGSTAGVGTLVLDGLSGLTPTRTPAGTSTPTPLPTPNGTNASTRATLAKVPDRTVRHGSATVLRGRLLDPVGRPIANAVLDVRVRVRMTGAKTRTVGTVRTDSQGRYAYRLPAGPSRDVTFAYRAHKGDRKYAVTRRTAVYVRARVGLARSAASLRNGARLTLTALVSGPSVRRRATTVAFQVKVGSRWQTFATGALDAHGVAHASHVFRYTTSMVTYHFRARTTRNAAFPYAPGTSAVQHVLVRP